MTTFMACEAAFDDLRRAARQLDTRAHSTVSAWKSHLDPLVYPLDTGAMARLAEAYTELCTQLTTVYLAGLMGPDDEASFEQLVASVPLLRDVAGPMITAWELAAPAPGPTPDEVDAAWAEFRRMVKP